MVQTSTPETIVPSGAARVSAEAPAPPEDLSGRPADAMAEHRQDLRRALCLKTCLIPLGSADDIYCTTDNISELGMHVTVPIGFGIAVGQRYELVIAGPEASSIGMGPHLTAGGNYATVVRTELHVGEDNTDNIGVGLRFDQPLMIS